MFAKDRNYTILNVYLFNFLNDLKSPVFILQILLKIFNDTGSSDFDFVITYISD